MPKYGIGMNAFIRISAMPRHQNRHVLNCFEAGREWKVFKWSSETGVHWPSEMYNAEGTLLGAETHDRLLSNTSQPRAAGGGGVLCWILSEASCQEQTLTGAS